MEQLFRAIANLSSSEIAPQLKGPYGQFYRHLYGGSEGPSERTDQVRLVDEARLVHAYAWGRKQGGYGEDDGQDTWASDYLETWKNE